MSRSRIVLVVLFCAALLIPTAAANASYSVLCSGYTSCSDKGYSNSGYASHKSTSYWGMYTGTNCTNYVAYRLVTTNGMPNVRPKSGVGNAQDWGVAMASVTDRTPTAGSVAWWGTTGHHVAYVEKVVSSSEIWVSESNWSGSFDWRKITKTGSGWPDGFIHFADRNIVVNAKPVIRGTVKVGAPLNASGGSWSPTGNTYTYRWLADGAAISGASSRTFTPTAAQLSKQLTFRVTATRPSYPTVRSTSAAIKVSPGTLTAADVPVVTGTARVGEPLSASAGTWTPTGSTHAYQWLVDGQPVPDATGTTFTPGPDQVGGRVTVTVTASKYGYANAAARSAPTTALAAGRLSSTQSPSVTGTARVGSTLTAQPGTWSTSGLTYAYQWLVDGAAVSGANEPTFVPRAADHNLPVAVRVTATRPGYTAASALSATTARVASGEFTLRSRPTISGTVLVGSRLTGSTGTWSPSGDYSYQWYADGRPVTGATQPTFTATPRERGTNLRLLVAAHRGGFTTKTALSVKTTEVGKGHIGVSAPPTITGSTRLGSLLTVSAGTHAPEGATLRHQWLRDGKVIAGATGRTHQVNTSDLGHLLSARVTFSANGYTSRAVTTAKVGPAKATAKVRVSATPGTRRVTFTIRVSAAGVPDPDGTVRVSYAGDQHRTVTVDNGRASLTLTGQESGAHTYTFAFGGTATVTSANYRRLFTIG